MADEPMVNGARMDLSSTSNTPIAQLAPSLYELSTRYIMAIVTLTWPYSSATGSVAFLLAEPDFRLRKKRGQVRVQFSGSSAKGIAKAGIASGDEVMVCLDGVEFVTDEVEVAGPGRGIEYELKFTERLLLEFRPEGSEEVKKIDIDHPALEPEVPVEVRVSTPEPDSPPPSIYSRNGAYRINGNEWSSPAFIKRARTSYGSLFEAGYDPFEEADSGRLWKGRKRARLSSTWRYSSRSPSPEVEETERESIEASPEPVIAWESKMVEDGNQTVPGEATQVSKNGDQDKLENAAETLAQFSKEATATENIAMANGQHALDSDTEPPVDQPVLSQDRSMPPPVIRTDFALSRETTPETDSALMPPLSPRLKPLSSDNLPLVSPLIASKLGIFTNPDIGINGQSLGLQPGSMILEQDVARPDDDLYSPSLAVLQREEEAEAFDGFSEPIPNLMEIADVDEISHPEPFQREHQSGLWQSVNAQTSQPASEDRLGQDKSREPEVGLYDDESDGREQDDTTLQVPHSGETYSQYPELGDEINGQSTTPWGQGSARFAYPDLPAPDVEGRTSSDHSPRSQAPNMSRSQSIHSAAIDLTESGDERGEEEELDQESDHEMEERYEYEEERNGEYSSSGSAGNEAGDDVHYQQGAPGRNRYFHEEDDCSDGDIDESDCLEDGDVESDYLDDGEYPNNNMPGQQAEFDSEEDEQEDSDDEMVDDNFRAPSEPVFIDLLSSDEDETLAAAPSRNAALTEDADQFSDEGEPDEDVYQDEEDEKAQSPPNGEEDEIGDEDNVFGYKSRHSHGRPESPRSGDEEDGAEEDGAEEDGAEEIDGEQENDVSAAEQTEFPSTITQAVIEVPVQQEISYPSLANDIEISTSNEYELVSHLDDATVVDCMESGPNGNIPSDAPEPDLDKEMVDESMTNELEPRGMDTAVEIEVQDSVQVVIANYGQNITSEKALDKQVPFQNTLGLDGVYDEPEVLSQDTGMEIVEDLSAKPSNARMPTPETTQFSQKTMSRISWSFITGIQREENTPRDSLSSATTTGVEILKTSIEEATTIAPDEESTGPSQPPFNGDDGENDAVDIRSEGDSIAIEYADEADIKDASAVGDKINDTEDRSGVGEETQVTPEPKPRRIRRKNEAEPSVSADSHEDPLYFSPRRSRRNGKSVELVPDPAEADRPTTSSSKNSLQPETEVTPRRSRRIGKSIGSVLAVAEGEISPTNKDDQISPTGHDVSIEMALSALNSPTKEYDLRGPPAEHLRLRLTKLLRKELGTYSGLNTLRQRQKQKLEVLAIAVTDSKAPARGKIGARDYMTTFLIADPGTASTVTEGHVYRPYEEALPIVKVGDGVLLRNFLAISVKGSTHDFGLKSERNEACSWAVFKDGQDEADVRGPPVEYGDAEKEYIEGLREWFGGLDELATTKLRRAISHKYGVIGVTKS